MTDAANLLYLQIRESPRLAGLTQPEIARKADIHQSQVSRILSGQFKRVTAPSIMKLCKFARIARSVDLPLTARLQNALKGVWDGSRAQEEGLVQLLKAVDALTLTRSGKRARTLVPRKRKAEDTR